MSCCDANIQFSVDEVALQLVSAEALNLSLGDVVNGTVVSASYTDRLQLLLSWNLAYAVGYTEYTYDGNALLTNIDIWDTAAKATKLFTKVLSYTGTQLDQIILDDELRNKTMTTDFIYSSGQLQNKTAVIT